jgi:hypothetical protein
MVAFVPQPPLLVPQLTAGRAADSEPVRAACLHVTARLAAVADRWVAVAADPGGRRSVREPVGGTFLGYGVDVPVALAPGAATTSADLPLPLLVAGWLRGAVAPEVVIEAELVPPELPVEDCARVGAELAERLGARDDPVALLVVGDGAITHGEKAPGYLDPRAEGFDAAVAAALAEADPERLLALDADLARELSAVGRAPWQVLAGAARAAGHRWRGELAYSAAPFGVAYHVALWWRDASRQRGSIAARGDGRPARAGGAGKTQRGADRARRRAVRC